MIIIHDNNVKTTNKIKTNNATTMFFYTSSRSQGDVAHREAVSCRPTVQSGKEVKRRFPARRRRLRRRKCGERKARLRPSPRTFWGCCPHKCMGKRCSRCLGMIRIVFRQALPEQKKPLPGLLPTKGAPETPLGSSMLNKLCNVFCGSRLAHFWL